MDEIIAIGLDIAKNYENYGDTLLNNPGAVTVDLQ